MSIEKDVEKKYIDDLERQNKKLKKKKKKRLLLLLLILLLLCSIGLMMGMLGLFPGMGDDGSESESDGTSSSMSAVDTSSSQPETVTTPTTEAEPALYDDVKVSGSTYIYQGQVKTLEEIKTIVSNMKENVVIRITDDNATKNAMDNLTNMLTDSGRSFSRNEMSSPSGTSSDAESSSQAETTDDKD